VGSAIAGSREFIARALRARKMFGGGMRQAGILAAAAAYALEHNVTRLADDHANAKRLADGLAKCSGVKVVAPETNIVYFDVDAALGTAADLAERCRAAGVWMIATGPQRIRAVTHLHITAACIDEAVRIVSAAVSQTRP
jgi:threonine aldolase